MKWSGMLTRMENGVGGSDLPQELLAVLPLDAQEQLDLAHRITARAVTLRLSKMEAETGKLRQKLTEKEHLVLGLQERMLQAQNTLRETNAKILQSVDEQAKLVDENNELAVQVKKLLRDVSKLETFKRALVQSLRMNERRPGVGGVRGVGGGVGVGGGNWKGRPPPLSMWKPSPLPEPSVTEAHIPENASPSGNSMSLNAKSLKSADEVASKSANMLRPSSGPSTPKLRTPGRRTPRLMTPTGSPKPQVPDFEIPTSLPTSLSGSRSTSPTRVSGQPRTVRLDAKEFFRQARSRLTYEQFGAFLVNIKELNGHQQTREEALEKADDIFGLENKDLYRIFESILSRHLSPS